MVLAAVPEVPAAVPAVRVDPAVQETAVPAAEAVEHPMGKALRMEPAGKPRKAARRKLPQPMRETDQRKMQTRLLKKRRKPKRQRKSPRRMKLAALKKNPSPKRMGTAKSSRKKELTERTIRTKRKAPIPIRRKTAGKKLTRRKLKAPSRKAQARIRELRIKTEAKSPTMPIPGKTPIRQKGMPARKMTPQIKPGIRVPRMIRKTRQTKVLTMPREIPQIRPMAAIPKRIPQIRPTAAIPKRIPQIRPTAAIPKKIPRIRPMAAIPKRIPRTKQTAAIPKRILQTKRTIAAPREILQIRQTADQTMPLPVKMKINLLAAGIPVPMGQALIPPMTAALATGMTETGCHYPCPAIRQGS